MTATYIGELSIGAAVPGAELAAAAGVGGINGALPDITARLGALAAFAPLPVNFATQLTLAQSIVASVESAIALGLPMPSIDAQIAAVSALVAELLVTVTAVNVQLAAVLAFQSQLAAAGVFAFAYAGAVNALGADFTTALAAGLPGGAPTDACHALVLATTTPATWTVMSQVFKVSP
jgi:hypothetical protein